MASALSPCDIMAGNKACYTISMQKQPKRQSEHNKALDNEGCRTPSMPIYCVFNETEGLSIIGLSEDMISYEIMDASFEITVVSFSEEAEFLNYLFLQPGNIYIRFETENYYIYGFIAMD